MGNDYSEDKLVQKTTIDYFKYNLDWDIVYAHNTEVLGEEGTLGRKSEKEVVLVRYLRRALKKLNPDLSEQVYEDGINQILENNASKSLIDINEEKYNLFKNGVKVQFKNSKGELDEVKLKIFDFKKATNNHFLAVRELWIRGGLYRKRADIIGFVNGIPLLFIELKNVHKDIRNAYEENFSDYKDTIPLLFNYNAIVMLSNGKKGKMGAVTSTYDFFYDWKRLKEEEEGNLEFKTMLDGVCAKKNFMDIFENFILFDDSSGKKVKIVAMNNQYLGVNIAFDKFEESLKTGDKKLGVFWHTQGSGKSYSIVFFCQKVHRKLKGNHCFLILTDRTELDSQLYQTFIGAKAVKEENKLWASSGEKLRNLLGEDHRYIFTLIQKFKEFSKEQFPNSKNVTIISDEAHRSQYGLLAKNMNHMLPDAKMLGFTGTPLFTEDEITKQTFGDYVSVYDFDRAVKDGATVPLYYQSRGDKLNIVDKELNKRIQEKIEEFDLSDETEERIRRALAKDYHTLTSNERLDKIAKDMVNHYSTMWESGKAMFVCIDKITCVRMYNLIDKYWKNKIQELRQEINNTYDDEKKISKIKKLKWMEETEYSVVISEEQNEISRFKEWGLDIEPHRRKMKLGIKRNGDKNNRDLATDFKDSKSPFRIVIVCAMWLTGFDVKSLGIIYLDKILKNHTLMQTIARANRVNEGKSNGLIIDYIGILKNLREALATYGNRPGTGISKPPAGTEQDLLKELAKSIELTRELFMSMKFNLDDLISANGFDKIELISDAEERINSSEEVKRKFILISNDVISKYKACLFCDEIEMYKNDYEAIRIIYKTIQEHRRPDSITKVMAELHAIVDDVIRTQQINEDDNNENKIFDISKIDFNKLKEEFKKSKRKNTTIQKMKMAIEDKLNRMLELNPLRMDFYIKYKKIINDYNLEKDSSVIESAFQALLIFVDELTFEERRALREGVNENELALFDLLIKPDMEQSEREETKKISIELLEIVKRESSAIDNWRDKPNGQAHIRIVIRNFLWENLPDVYTDSELNSKIDVVYNHFFENYKELNDKNNYM